MSNDTTSTDSPLGYGGRLIADVFMDLYENDPDEKWILAAEDAALKLTFGRISVDTLPDYIAGLVAGLKED